METGENSYILKKIIKVKYEGSKMMRLFPLKYSSKLEKTILAVIPD
jgi:hypothetical protein